MIHLMLAALVLGAAQTPDNPLNIPPPSAAEMQSCAPPGVTSRTPMSAIPRARMQQALHCLQGLIARQINSVAPLAVDEATTLLSANAVGATLEYHYRVDVDAAEVDAAQRDSLAGTTTANACNTDRLRRSLALGASYRYVWEDRLGAPLHQLLLTRCPGAARPATPVAARRRRR